MHRTQNFGLQPGYSLDEFANEIREDQTSIDGNLLATHVGIVTRAAATTVAPRLTPKQIVFYEFPFSRPTRPRNPRQRCLLLKPNGETSGLSRPAYFHPS